MKKLILASVSLLLINCKKNEATIILKNQNKYDIHFQKFEKIKSLEGNWYLFNEPNMLKYGSINEPFISYEITSAGNAVVEKLFLNQAKEMTTVYHMNIDELVLTHYCSLGNQPYLVANIDNNFINISFDFVNVSNMQNINDAHIHKHSLEIISPNEMIAHWGTWKDQRPFGVDRAFHVYKK